MPDIINPSKFHNPTHARAWMRSTVLLLLLLLIMPLCVLLSEIVLKSIEIASVLL